MTETTYELVRRCPRCDEPGEEKAADRLTGSQKGSKTTTFFCRNSRCKWFNTSWLVQIMPDGTIHPATLKRAKSFPALNSANAAAAIQYLQEIYEASLRPEGGEIRG